MNNENERKRRARLTWFDVLLIAAVVLGLAAGILGVRHIGRTSVGEDGYVVYTVMLNAIERESAEMLDRTEGQMVKNGNGTQKMGTVTAVRHVSHQTPSVGNGRVEFVESDVYEDCYVSISSPARERGIDGIRVGDIRIAAGELMSLHLGAFAHVGAQIVSVEWEAADEEATMGAD